ncbi:hypothetical protein SALBM217S_03811 [Streptomyces griseoloalbus]
MDLAGLDGQVVASAGPANDLCSPDTAMAFVMLRNVRFFQKFVKLGKR